jgi:hypothetical protein
MPPGVGECVLDGGAYACLRGHEGGTPGSETRPAQFIWAQRTLASHPLA